MCSATATATAQICFVQLNSVFHANGKDELSIIKSLASKTFAKRNVYKYTWFERFHVQLRRGFTKFHVNMRGYENFKPDTFSV